MSDFDQKELGYIDFEDFAKILSDRMKPYENDTKRRKTEIFRGLSQRKQTIELEDLEASFHKNGFNLTQEEIKEIF